MSRQPATSTSLPVRPANGAMCTTSHRPIPPREPWPQSPRPWAVAPNAAGLPRIGNSGFALGLTAPTPPLFAAAQLGLTNSTQPIVLGVQLLVDPLVNLVLAPGSTMQVPLAIPYASNLIGTEVLAQVLFFDSSVMLGATAGVQVTVLP